MYFCRDAASEAFWKVCCFRHCKSYLLGEGNHVNCAGREAEHRQGMPTAGREEIPTSPGCFCFREQIFPFSLAGATGRGGCAV